LQVRGSKTIYVADPLWSWVMAGRPRGATSWGRNLENVAAHHAKVLLELWLAGAPVRRYTVPPAIKRRLCQLAIAHVMELRRQTILRQWNEAIESDLQRQGYSDGQIAEIMRRRVPERPHVEPPDIQKVLAIVNRRAPPATLRRKAKDRVSTHLTA
jgi:hypothetical protein